MTTRAFLLSGMVLACSCAMSTAGFAACDVRSGSATVALVELYTSEGCSSCPPADKGLMHLRETLGPTAQAIPLALHVGYWDYLGWRDPYAKDAFTARQSWLAQRGHSSSVYTPHFFVNGAEFGFRTEGLREEVRRVNATPAKAEIRVMASVDAKGALAVSADATAQPRSTPIALYLAVTESGLSSNVARGENRGVTLAHDHVVREWVGPVRLASGAVHVERAIALPPAWNRAQLDVVAFVEDESTGVVLQAVNAGRCARS